MSEEDEQECECGCGEPNGIQWHIARMREQWQRARKWAFCYLNNIVQTGKRETWSQWDFVYEMARDIDAVWWAETEFRLREEAPRTSWRVLEIRPCGERTSHKPHPFSDAESGGLGGYCPGSVPKRVQGGGKQ